MTETEFSSPEPVEKLAVPQLRLNGISQDFANEYVNLFTYINQVSIDKALEIYQRTGLRKYEERFNPDEYDSVVTPENSQLVQEIDAQIDRLRALFDSGNVTVEEFNDIYRDLDLLVRGEIE